MKNTIPFLFMFLLGMMNSCSQDNTPKLNLITEKEYLTGFLSHSKIAIVNGEKFICHYDLVTHKKILAESLQSDEKHIIDLSEIINAGSYRIKAFEIINWDEIYLLPAYATELIVANGNGQEIKKLDLAPYLDKEGEFALMNWTGSFVINDTSMLFPLEFGPGSLPIELREDLNAYDSARYISPRLFKINNFRADSLTIQFGTRKLYKRFAKENVLALDKNNYRFINNQIIFSSMYTDSIYTINPSSLEITGSYKIESDYTGLIVSHITRQEMTESGENLLMNNIYSNGNIDDIVFDELSKNYFVSIFHKGKELKETSVKSNWSFVILDSTFTKIDEIKMDADSYNPACLSTSEGLYLAANVGHKNDTNYYKKFNYAIFKYE